MSPEMFSALFFLFPLLVSLFLTVRWLSKSCHHATLESIQMAGVQHAASSEKVRRGNRLKMALHKVERPWLLIDGNYVEEHKIRQGMFQKKRKKILGCKPVAIAACQELLQLVVEELLVQYPDAFRLADTDGGRHVEIIQTGEGLPVQGPPTGTWQLETAAMLAMEDFNILMPDHESEIHRLYV